MKDRNGPSSSAFDSWSTAASAFERSGDRESEAKARTKMGLWHAERREVKLAVEQYFRAAQLFELVGNVEEEAGARMREGAALSFLDRDDDAIRSFDRAANLFRELGNVEMEVVAEEAILTLLVEVGRWDEVFEVCERLIQTAASENTDRFQLQVMQAYYQWARGLGLKGDIKESLPKAQRAAEIAQDLEEWDTEAQMRVGLALGYTEQKRYAEALPEFDRLFSILPGSGKALLAMVDDSPGFEALCRSNRADCLRRAN